MTPAPRAREGRDPRAARAYDQEPTESQKAVARVLAREVAALLEPALAEMSRKLDTISQRLDGLLGQLARLAQWDPDALHVLLARVEELARLEAGSGETQ